MALTATETGEKAYNFKRFGEQDIVTGDHAYCSKQGIAYLLGRNSGFLFRFGTKRFHVYNLQGRKANALGYFKGLKSGGIGEQTLYYEMEAVLSNLKRGFEIRRCVWKGFEHYRQKVFWSVIAYNFRIMTGAVLANLKLSL
jgi:hypothetical protein